MKNKKRPRKQDRRTQIRILKEQGCWDPVGAINRINELARAKMKIKRSKREG